MSEWREKADFGGGFYWCHMIGNADYKGRAVVVEVRGPWATYGSRKFRHGEEDFEGYRWKFEHEPQPPPAPLPRSRTVTLTAKLFRANGNWGYTVFLDGKSIKRLTGLSDEICRECHAASPEDHLPGCHVGSYAVSLAVRIRDLEAQLANSEALREAQRVTNNLNAQTAIELTEKLADALSAVKAYHDNYHAESAKLAIVVEALEWIANEVRNGREIPGPYCGVDTRCLNRATQALARIRGTK